MPFPGEIVPLSHQAHDRDPYLEVYAEVKSMPSGISVAGSPFKLYPLGLGKYSNNTLIMPANVEYLEITYVAYTFDGVSFSKKHSTWGAVAPKRIVQDGRLTIVQVERIVGVVKQRPKIRGLVKC